MKTLANLFRLNGKPIELAPSQQEVFDLILHRKHPRNQIIMPTQYGKSLTVALATLLRVNATNERFTILAPSEKKAGIIMNYVIDHTFDSPMLLSRLELDNNTTLDRLRRERSRTHMTYKGGGGVQTLSLDARNGKRSIEAAMGFGGNRIILDESSLIDDPLYATVKRMLGGYRYDDTFLLEIGNPFYRNHFYRTWHDDRYHKLFVDYHVALKEGRYSPEFIEEMRQEAFFDVFYECLFPDEDAVDERGYRTLVTHELLERRRFSGSTDPNQPLKLGVDIGGGGDENVFVLRNAEAAWIEGRNRSHDTMSNVNEVIALLKRYPALSPEEVYIDDIGIGRGVSDRLKEMGYDVNGVSVGEKASDPTRFKNIKAEAYWGCYQWLKDRGRLVWEQGFAQLTWIKYKVSTDKVIQIEPKDELKKRSGKSPDCAEAFALTFAPSGPRLRIR